MKVNTNVTLDEASCLVALEAPLKTVFVCPHGSLIDSDSLGPHYSDEDRSEAIKRVDALLTLAHEREAELVMAPEYFCPLERMRTILNNPQHHLRQGTLYALPIESISPEDYADLQSKCGENGHAVTAGDISTGTSVNVCAILYLSTSGQLIGVLQPKIYPSPPEETKLSKGDTLFVLRGRHIGFMVLICSDANHGGKHAEWADAAARHGGMYVAHLQFNPTPDYENYPVFRNAILSKEEGQHRLIFSLNWAKDSRLIRRDGSVIPILRARTRVFRGKKYRSRPLCYGDISRAGLHNYSKPASADGKHGWDIWHCMSYGDHAHYLEASRALENRSVPEVTGTGIFAARFLRLAGGLYGEEVSLDPVSPVIEQCRSQGVPEKTLGILQTWGLSEIECFVNSILLHTKGCWFDNDLCRIPTAPHVCVDGLACVNNGAPCNTDCQHWKRAFEWVCDALTRLANHNNVNEVEEQILVPNDYPANIRSGESGAAGLLIHSQGRRREGVEGSLCALLLDMKNTPRDLTIFCPDAGPLPDAESVGGRLGRTIGDPSTEAHDIADPADKYNVHITTI